MVLVGQCGAHFGSAGYVRWIPRTEDGKFVDLRRETGKIGEAERFLCTRVGYSEHYIKRYIQ